MIDKKTTIQRKLKREWKQKMRKTDINVMTLIKEYSSNHNSSGHKKKNPQQTFPLRYYI